MTAQTKPAKASSKSKAVAPPKDKPQRNPDTVAKLATLPSFGGASVINQYAHSMLKGLNAEGGNFMTLWDEVRRDCGSVADGVMYKPKAMLAVQSEVLQAMFFRYAELAVQNLNNDVNTVESLMRMALKAQAQCRATIETLNEINNPCPVAFVRQQTNISSDGGPQQVNVGTPPPAPAREATPNPAHELLEQSNGEWLDTGAQGQAGRGHKTLEAVGAVDRSQD